MTKSTAAAANSLPCVDATAAWHALDADRALAQAHATRQGLTSAEARRRRGLCGPNVLPAPARPGLLAIGFRQLRSPLIYILLAAAAGSLALGHVSDAGFIGFVLLVNSLLGGWQEWNAERQNASLQRWLRIRATVLRDGGPREIDAEDLVPGDIVALESGQRVPADLRLLSTHGLEIDEALLTGESLPVAKDAAWRGATDVPLADRSNMAFAASTAVRGRGQGVVVATGGGTEVGALAATLTASPGGKPPLTERMERFSRVVALTVLGAALAIGLVAVFVHHQPVFVMFTFGVALAVSAIPEGLPVAVTIALAIAARRMAGRGAIVRQLPAVEGLGSCSLIASDKTGTLTCNELTVCALQLASGAGGRVTGAGYAPDGEILMDTRPAGGDATLLHDALEIAVACNEADLARHDGRWEWRGDPTDVALLAFAGKGGVQRADVIGARPQTNHIPFEPERQYAATFHRCADGSGWVAVKGAPERVLGMCVLDEGSRRSLAEAAESMARRGLRVLALASGQLSAPAPPGEAPPVPGGLALKSLVGLIDPLRPEAADAVRRCHGAGIRVIMLTGDHPLTALAIARELGIAEHAEDVVLGGELDRATPEALAGLVARACVFARVTPAEKLVLVEAAANAGQFVAVTGDGVNDAPALRRANVGIAMGRGGTDVAREAADLVLSDDNFATIVAGVEEGRVAYRNIRNVVYLLTAAGVAEVLTVGVAVVAGLPLPLLPVQLLWLNLVTNGIQDVGLAFERGRGDELGQPPRPRGEPIFDRVMVERGLLAGLWMSAAGLSAYVWMLSTGLPVEHARNNLLLMMVLMQNVDAINARSETRSVLGLPVSHNPLLMVGVTLALAIHVVAMYLPWLQRVLQVHPPTPGEWLVLPLAALSLFVVMEAQKLSLRRRGYIQRG